LRLNFAKKQSRKGTNSKYIHDGEFDPGSG
jgi:hypothetical protein